MRKLISFFVLFAIVFMIFHEQMPTLSVTKTDICSSTESVCIHSALSEIHEQIHAFGIFFESLNILLPENFKGDEFYATNILYNFISFNLPYRPPATI